MFVQRANIAGARNNLTSLARLAVKVGEFAASQSSHRRAGGSDLWSCDGVGFPLLGGEDPIALGERSRSVACGGGYIC